MIWAEVVGSLIHPRRVTAGTGMELLILYPTQEVLVTHDITIGGLQIISVNFRKYQAVPMLCQTVPQLISQG